MSTRATYQFNHKEAGIITFYIHYDGYPEGAARYLLNMHKAVVKGKALSSQFVVGNPLMAEITIDHRCHADTEFRYSFHHDGTMEAQKEIFAGDLHKFVTFFTGHYAEFINEYLPQEIHGSGYTKIDNTLHKVDNTLSFHAHKEWITVDEMVQLAHEANQKLCNFQTDNPNAKAYSDIRDFWVTQARSAKNKGEK